jgi:hypothetical protein
VAIFRDVTQEVIQKLNKNIPSGDGKELPNRLPIIQSLKEFDGKNWKPKLNPQDNKWINDFNQNPIDSIHLIQAKNIDKNTDEVNLQLFKQIPNSDSFNFILEREGHVQPKLIAVSIPKASSFKSKTSLPFLIYFRPLLGQNIEKRFGGSYPRKPGYYMGYENLANEPLRTLSESKKNIEKNFYPFGWDYLYFNFWPYMNYVDNPIINFLSSSFVGLPDQIKISNKEVVLIIPILSNEKKAGDFTEPDKLLVLLNQLQEFILREKLQNTDTGPFQLGRVAVGAFSAGNALTIKLLQNSSHWFCRKHLQEVYGVDPPYNPQNHVDTAEEWIQSVLAWSSKDANKIIRLYTQTSFPSIKKIANVVEEGKIKKTNDGNRSVLLTGDEAWKTLLGQVVIQFSPNLKSILSIPLQEKNIKKIGDIFLQNNFKGQKSFNIIHSLIPSTTLTDALTRSKF